MSSSRATRSRPRERGARARRYASRMTEKLRKSDEEWRRELTPEQYEVLRGKGTERPWTGELNGEKRPGVFRCASAAELMQ